jgi:hypothetical protein
VTIEGGPGWQVDGSSPDVIGADPGSGPRRWPSRGLVSAVVLSGLLGFVAATVLAAWRHDRAGEIDAATLAVSAWSDGDGGFSTPVSQESGRPVVRIPFQLYNAGPRAIGLLSVRLPDTDVTTGDLAGRRLPAGTWARLSLVRSLDCDGAPRQLAGEGDVSRLVVRARTGAGERQVEVRVPLNTRLLTSAVVTELCGDLPPDESLVTDDTELTFAQGAGLLTLQVANGSRHPLAVGRLTSIVPWVAVRFVDERGRPLPEALTLPAGDFRTPRRPWELSAHQTWRVELTVPDCGDVPRPLLAELEEPLLSVELDSGTRAGTARFGAGPNEVLPDLVRTACPSAS